MTSINALRFNDYSGIMICDEQRSWNPEDMKIFVSDKIKPIIPQEIIDEMGLVAAYGNTGTSTIGDEIKFTISRKLHEEYKNLKEKNDGKIPEKFKTMEDMSELVYGIITGMKHNHISQQMKGLYGFDSNDYMAGSYEKNGKKIELKDKEILEDCQKFMTWKGSIPDTKSVFMNAGILAGYDDSTGFRIFHFSIWKMFKEEVDIAYAAGGSGSDMKHFI
jgi:rRNA-processing protein FCF1